MAKPKRTSTRPRAVRDAEAKRQQTAFHEAGHAVADIRLLGASPHVTIVPNRKRGCLGSTSTDQGWDDHESAGSAGKHLVSLYAGFAAEQRLAPGADQRGARGDFARAQRILVTLYGAKEGPRRVDEWREKAAAFVAEPENWRAIERFAAELLEHGTVDGQLSALLVDVADRKANEASWRAARRQFESMTRPAKALTKPGAGRGRPFDRGDFGKKVLGESGAPPWAPRRGSR